MDLGITLSRSVDAVSWRIETSRVADWPFAAVSSSRAEVSCVLMASRSAIAWGRGRGRGRVVRENEF